MSEVELIKLYHDNHETRKRMPRWLAELEIGTIASEQPEVKSARIVEYSPVVNAKSTYRQNTRIDWNAALQLGKHLTTMLVA